jgi:hypothetical protein
LCPGPSSIVVINALMKKTRNEESRQHLPVVRK